MPLITGSVGRAGVNRRRDVIVVQHLLNRAPGGPRLEEDGVAGHRTVGAIRDFQTRVLKYPRPDARVDPQGRMLRSLAASAGPRPRKAAAAEPGLIDGVGKWAESAWNGLESVLSSWWAEERVQTGKAASVGKKAGGGTAGGGRAGLTDADYVRAAQRLSSKVDPLLVKALAEKESGGKSGFGSDGRVVIAFEGHKFRKYTKRLYDQSHPKLSYPYTRAGWKAKWRVNNANQKTSWKSLEEAMGLDHDAALKSTSFGAFQVLGENYADCGYSNVRDFVDLMKSGDAGQLEAFVLFCKAKPGLLPAMERQDFAMIGNKYNGSAQEGYSGKLRKIYDRLKAGK